MWASNSSGVVSSSVPRDVSPAALTRQSTRPWRSIVCDVAVDLVDVGDVGLHVHGDSRVALQIGDQCLADSARRPVTATVAPSRPPPGPRPRRRPASHRG